MDKQILEGLNEGQLRKILKDKNIYFNENYTKDHLIDLLMNFKDNSSDKTPKSKNGVPNIIGKVGAVLNIIFAFIFLILYLLLILIFTFSPLFLFYFWVLIILIPLAMSTIFCIVINIRLLKGKRNKITAGVLGLFSGIIGGILVLVSKIN